MMNLNNYNALSQQPTDQITRDVITFGEHIGFDQIIFAASNGQLQWEAQTDDIFGEVYIAAV
ncbi:hypothetical protein ACPV3A_14550 [Paenibacillus sp. Dod16]|uniref:hypothetical protein n=1 Tax=Paenibacillus sp. Dod16 TaxID=3416392 RepID=UPI003CF49E64